MSAAMANIFFSRFEGTRGEKDQIFRTLVDVSLRELEFQLSKGRRSLVAAEKKSYFRTLTGNFLYWVSLLLNVIKGHLKVHENASLMLLC